MLQDYQETAAQKLVRWGDCLAIGVSCLFFLFALAIVISDWSSGPRPFNQQNFNATIGLVLVVGSFCLVSMLSAFLAICFLFLGRKLQKWKFSRPQLIRLGVAIVLLVLNGALFSQLHMPHT